MIIESGSLEHRIIDYNTKSPNICDLSFEKTETLDLDRYWELCGEWYEDHNIEKEEFETWPYSNGLNKGDIIVVHGLTPRTSGKLHRHPTNYGGCLF